MKELVSVIIPVYNAEKYLQKCMESIIVQTYKNIQIILVDDGSTDGSSELCDCLARQDHRIKVLHKANEGPSETRNAGIEQANGEYILFVDSDDYIEKDLIEKCLDTMKKEDSDVVVFNYVNEDEHGEAISRTEFSPGSYILKSEKDRMEFLIKKQIRYKYMGWCPWNRMFRADLIKDNHILFPSGVNVAEDLGHAMKTALSANKYTVIEDGLYHYITRANSIMDMNKVSPIDKIVCMCRDFDQYAGTRVSQKALESYNSGIYSRILSDEFRKYDNDTQLKASLNRCESCDDILRWFYESSRLQINNIKRLGIKSYALIYLMNRKIRHMLDRKGKNGTDKK